MPQVGFDHRAITIDGKRTLLMAGAVHYPRSTPQMWPTLMRRSRDAGLNTIETYVFWNLHERERGVFDFSDRLDLYRFCETAQAEGMHVVLRIGPYVCAETNYGGLPPWLRDVPGMEMRTWNEPFQREKARWVKLLAEYLKPMFAPNGGPIVMGQMENEYNNIAKYYGNEGQRYLKWSVDLALSLDLKIPWIMCVGAAEGAIETINEFYGHNGLAEHFKNHPEQPAMWTEAYPGWYDTWGYSHNIRSVTDQAYATARFFAGGGTGINYYMWHGGTNFGRETMYLQTTSYDFDAPLDEFGLETTKSRHLGVLHRLLLEHSGAMLGDRPTPVKLGADQSAFVYGSGAEGLAFLCNDAESAAAVSYEGKSWELAARSVLVVRGGVVLFNSAKVDSGAIVTRVMNPLPVKFADFTSHAEPAPGEWPTELREATSVISQAPIEQLKLTQDRSDYCWYSVNVSGGTGTLELQGVADLAHVFAGGELVATSKTPLVENRPLKDNEGFKQKFELRLPPGEQKLDILCCAIGLIKGDWMLGFQNMVEERKGIWGAALWNGTPIRGEWRMLPGTVGERARLFEPAVASVIEWKSANEGKGKPLTWWRSSFAMPASGEPIALDLTGMNKGLAWLNGRCLGRYWLIQAAGKNAITPNVPTAVQHTGEGEPTQRYYHVPREWLADRNTLVLFEELGGDPSGIHVCSRK